MNSAAASLPAALLGPLAPPVPARAVRVAVVGLGKMGVAHTSVLSMVPGVQLVGCIDRTPALGQSLRGMGFDVPFFPTLEGLLGEAQPEAVFLCTPQHIHRTLGVQCLEAGASVFVEKPLAHRYDEALALAEAVRAAGRPAACGFTLAYFPTFALARRLIEAGAPGAIREVRSSMYLSQVFGPKKGWMYDPAISGGGVLANITSHLLFLLDWYFGAPATVRATSRKLHGAVEDEMRADFQMQAGHPLTMETSWSVPGYPLSAVEIVVAGDAGTLRVTMEGVELDLSRPVAGLPAGGLSVTAPELPQRSAYDVNGEAYYLEDAGFIAWVAGGEAVPGTVEAGLRVQGWMDALYRSCDAAGAETSLP